MAKKTIGIYKITSPTNNVYVGQSVYIENRINSYKNLKCKSQVLLYRSFLKHGVDNHVFEIIEECSIEELNNRERYYQDLFDCIGNKGLNCKLTKSNDKSISFLIKNIQKSLKKKCHYLIKVKIILLKQKQKCLSLKKEQNRLHAN